MATERLFSSFGPDQNGITDVHFEQFEGDASQEIRKAGPCPR
ncbi:MAG TPA: hypothetical protein VLT32_21655 [Candidatus Sulfomarinibacteraceae bacterium]|nr:hypothetical protein [Candidatus Sulfomarinibacteraceae bacterium]